MIRVVNFDFQGDTYPIFIDDTDTGYNGKDILTKPGIYDEITNENFTLPLAELQGSIDGYATKCMALLVSIIPGGSVNYQVQDCTDQIKKFLTVPETAAKMLIMREDEESRDFITTALEVIHHYEATNEESKVFLPESALKFIDEAVAKKMMSTRHVYVLRNVDNQEIVQKDCTSTYGVVLPSVSDLHTETGITPNTLDLLRVIAPCRKEVSAGRFQYSGIYHTPYFRIDPKIRGAVPSHLNFLNGFPKNDLLDIQPFERHMYDNLYTFICSDAARYVSEIVTGLFFTTTFGQHLKRFISCKDKELLSKLMSDILNVVPEGVTCTLSFSALQEVLNEEINSTALAKLIKSNLTATTEYVFSMVEQQVTAIRIVDIANLPFVLDISDNDKDELTAILNKNNIVTREMLDYILALCTKAYSINWGHSGATRAIPGFVMQSDIQNMNEILSAYLTQVIGNVPAPANIDFSLLYEEVNNNTDDDEDSDDSEEEITTSFDYYITNDTALKVRNNTLSADFFSGGGVTGAETSESAIVEYWRKVNGDSGLSYFISSSFISTGDVRVLIECFIKLMRWGTVKPSLLVLQNYPKQKTVFDLNTGKEIPNTLTVDESKLVLVNGCKHSLAGILTSQDIIGSDDAMVGFLLCKDYGIKKYILASWVDIGEMIAKGEVDVDAFKTVTTINIDKDFVKDISSFENSGYEFYSSDYNIERGLQYNVAPSALNELALLINKGILRSIDYLKSKQSKMIITTKDRQYQILTDYCDLIRTVYETERNTLSGSQISTADLSAVAVKMYNLYTKGSRKQIPDVNEARSKQAVLSMNLDIDGYEYDNTSLEGKFAIISDMEMKSNLPSISFTDAGMQSVSKKVRDRIVLLLLETEDSFVLCRKDIVPAELLVSKHTIVHKTYNIFAPVIKALKSGQSVTISSASSGIKKLAKLHESVSEFI